MRKSAYKMRKFILFVLKMIGIGLVIYPFVSDFIYSRAKDSMIITYEDSVGAMEAQAVQDIFESAYQYNETLALNNISLVDPFGKNESLAQTYESLLKINDGSGMMGYITIPCIDVELPIFHGTSQAVLEKGVGHLGGTSLPVGGKSTHAVLTGHTGLNNAKLFTDLIQMIEGDCFYITIFEKTIGYEVIDINTVTPDQADAVEIIKNKDLCTLVTCTPYGVNTHRLLVTGERMDEAAVTENMEKMTDMKGSEQRESQWMDEYKKAVVLGLLIVIILVVILKLLTYLCKTKGKRSEKRKYKKPAVKQR